MAKDTETKAVEPTMDELEILILTRQQAAVQAFKDANAAFLAAIAGVDLSNRAGTNTGNFLMQTATQAKNNAGQFDNLLKELDLRLNPVTEDFSGAGGGIAPAPSRL